MGEIKTIEDLREDPSNANQGTPRGHAIIERSVSQRGAGRSGLAAKDGTMIAGSQTLQKMAELGIPIKPVHTTGEEWVVVIRDDIEPGSEEARLLAIEDNRSSEVGLSWSPDVLASLAAEIDLSALFYKDELAGLLEGVQVEPGGGGDEIPAIDPSKPARVQPGDLWLLGEHKLLCADSRDINAVQSLMSDEIANLVVTSPPYGVGKEYETGGVQEWHGLMQDVFSNLSGLSPLWFVNLADRRTGNDGYEAHTYGLMVALFADLGYNLIGTRIWAKNPAWSSQSPYWNHTYKPVDDFEFLGLFASEKPKHKERLSRDDRNEWGYRGVWEFASVGENREHSAAYPVELPLRAIRMLTDAGDLVLDPFVGSGTTIIAGQRARRRVYAIERDPRYADLCLARAEAEGLTCTRVE